MLGFGITLFLQPRTLGGGYRKWREAFPVVEMPGDCRVTLVITPLFQIQG